MSILKKAFLFACAFWLVATISMAQPVKAQSNILSNPSFEPGSGAFATGWTTWYREENGSGDCSNSAIYHKPNWNVEVVGGQNGQLWFDGRSSQQVGNQFGTWHAGVMQEVSVTQGSRYRFSSYAWGRASQDQYPAPSDRGVNLNFIVGIDPNGGGQWSSPDVIWSAPVNPHDTWLQAAVEATATGTSVTVFVGANLGGAGQCRAHLDMWFDAAELIAMGPPPTNTRPPVTATPTRLPVTATPTRVPPTATRVPPTDLPPTAVPTEWPTNTPLPTATPYPTNTPLPTGPWYTKTPAPVPTVLEATLVVPTAAPVLVFNPTPVPVIATAVPASADDNAQATQSAEPTALPTNTATPISTGKVCVNSFADENANGVRDENEGYMAGIPLLVGQNGAVLTQGISTGTNTPVCFSDLAAGTYEIAQRLPSGIEMTTAGNMTLEVNVGDDILLEFGSRLKPVTVTTPEEEVAQLEATPEVTATPLPTTTPSRNTATVIGGVALGAAVLLLGVILAMLLRK